MSASSSSSSGSESDEETKQPAKKAAAEDPIGKPVSVDADSDDSGSESDSDSDAKKKKKDKEKKAKKKKKEKKEKKGKKEKKKGKDKKEKKGKDRKKKKEKKMNKAKRDSVSNQFGKYGIIKQEDFFSKKPEFLLWAIEVRKENTDAMGQMQLKDLFKEYVEDYNTATMPSKKYYNLQVWENEMQFKKRKKKGEDVDAKRVTLASFDDERARREEINQLKIKKQEMQVTEEVRKMKQDKSKAEEMRHQGLLRTQMDLLNKSGNVKEAQKIAERLTPSAPETGKGGRR